MGKQRWNFGSGTLLNVLSISLFKRVVSTLFLLFLGCATKAYDMTRALAQGDEFAAKGDHMSAVYAYEKALKAVPSSQQVRRKLAIASLKTGDCQRAAHILSSLDSGAGHDVERLYFWGESLRCLENYNLAVEKYKSALGLSPQDMRLIKALAWTYLKIKNVSKTLEILGPYEKNPKKDPQIHLIFATAYNEKKQFDKTVQILRPYEHRQFQAIRKNDPPIGEAERILLMHTLAESYRGLRQCGQAEKLYQRILKTRPFFAPSLTGSAECDLQQSRQEHVAIKKLEQAVKADPYSARPYFLLEKIYDKKEDKSKSLFYKEKFLKISEKNSGVLQ